MFLSLISYLFIYLFIFSALLLLHLSLSLYPSVHPPIYLTIHLSISLSICILSLPMSLFLLSTVRLFSLYISLSSSSIYIFLIFALYPLLLPSFPFPGVYEADSICNGYPSVRGRNAWRDEHAVKPIFTNLFLGDFLFL